jgi:hypothetical protein
MKNRTMEFRKRRLSRTFDVNAYYNSSYLLCSYVIVSWSEEAKDQKQVFFIHLLIT